ncbi:MAG: hypothetical protein HN764_09080 [Gammaproteobacteria bacterium]|nr:hypothetical protein [Gammaproteobacteria bacterium]
MYFNWYNGSKKPVSHHALITHIVCRFILCCLLLVSFSFPFAVYADDDDATQKIEDAADKIKELIEAYQEAEVNFVKQEVVTIKDTAGNPRDCDVAIFYDNGQQARFKTSGGSFDGNFDHGSNVPTNALSLRLSNCECRAVSTKHLSTWLGVIDEIEKVKKVIADEIEGMLEDKAKEYAEEVFNKLAEKAGLAAGASGFLTGFKAGAELGAAVGEHITEEINKILDNARQRNQQAAQDNDNAPLYPNVGHVNPRSRWGNFRGENPQLRNKWDITVRCGSNVIPPSRASWSDVSGLVTAGRPAQTAGPSSQSSQQAAADRQAARERAEQERQERQAEAQRERERRQQEAEAARRQAEAERRYEEEQRRLKAEAQEISRTCKICDPIRDQIAKTQQDIEDAESQLPDLEKAVSDAEDALNRSRNKERQARNKLDEFLNPQSSATNLSTGRAATTTDLEVRNQAAMEAMDRYQAGEATAEETSEAWRDLDNPQQIEELKQRAKDRLEAEIDTAKQEREQKESELSTARQSLGRENRRIEGLKSYLEELRARLEECIKQCQAQAMDIARGRVSDLEDLMDYSVPQTTEETEEEEEENNVVVNRSRTLC